MAGGRTFLPGLCFSSDEFLAPLAGLYIPRCWMIKVFGRRVFSIVFAVAFTFFAFSSYYTF